jgi:hypothetical protein
MAGDLMFLYSGLEPGESEAGIGVRDLTVSCGADEIDAFESFGVAVSKRIARK